MKICMVVTSNYDIDNRVKREARALVGAGHRVSVICLDPSQEGKIDVLDGVKVIRLAPVVWRGGLHESPLGLFRYLRRLFTVGTATQVRMYQAMLAETAEAYHAHDFDTLLPACAAAKRTKDVLVYDSHELFVDTLNEFHSDRWLELLYTKVVVLYCRWAERRGIRQAKRSITVNHPIADLLAKRYKVEKPLVLMNCVDYRPVDRQEGEVLRHKVGVGPDDVIALYQGGYGRGRGLSQLVQCIPFLPPNYHLAFLGYGELQKSLEDLASTFPQRDRVHFLSVVPSDQLLAHTAGADVGVMTIEDFNLSKRYATPNKLFEYMMAGVPIASSKLPVLEQIVGGEKIGLFFPSLDPRDIARTIVQVRESPEYDQMKARALTAARERYNWSVESVKLVELYKNL